MNQVRQAKREKWRQIVESQRASGQSAAAWCREHGVKQASFFAWKRRLQIVLPASDFVEVHATAELGRGGGDADGVQGEVATIEVCFVAGNYKQDGSDLSSTSACNSEPSRLSGTGL